jgi:hypothetical protein
MEGAIHVERIKVCCVQQGFIRAPNCLIVLFVRDPTLTYPHN